MPASDRGGEPTGEIWWFFADTVLRDESGASRVAGDFFPRDSFPIIVKTLHAASNLSVQVHPGKDGRKPKKDESWIVLEGSGNILHGVADGVTPSEFGEAVENGTVENLLLRIHGEPGVFVHLPAGTIHALGAGLTVLEVQLNCTVTYRLWDYNRRDVAGNRRELHVAQGLKAVNWKTMGRAVRIHGDCLDAGSYYMQRVEAGVVRLKPLELLFVPAKHRCFFADGLGGDVEVQGDSWVVGVRG